MGCKSDAVVGTVRDLMICSDGASGEAYENQLTRVVEQPRRFF
jgi:hypothetical protein